jgi:hypothetical protein
MLGGMFSPFAALKRLKARQRHKLRQFLNREN